jgi:hypothetical protein
LIDPLLLEQYESADYYIEAIPPFILKIGIHSYELSKIYETSQQTKAALITASNPRSKKLPNEINKVRKYISDFNDNYEIEFYEREI